MNGYLFGATSRAVAEHAAVSIELYGHTFHGHVENRSLIGATDFPVAVLLEVPDNLTEIRPAIPGMDGPSCPHCGGMTKRGGTCYLCTNCGETTGCG